MARYRISSILIFLLLIQTFSNPVVELTNNQKNDSYFNDQIFNGTGFNQIDTFTTNDSETHVSRPKISWSMINPALMASRTGACSVAIDSLDEVWLMGGYMDPNPSQNGDEMAVGLIEVYDNVNNTWMPSQSAMPYAQGYCEAELIGDLIYVVGEWPRGSGNPPATSSGRVQIYNISNGTWYNGTDMPTLNGRGNGGLAQANGILYYAGGVRNQGGTDATNRTYRYNPANDSWDRMADMTQPRASFELVNFHGQLYAIGGYQGTSSWNRQGLNYVERYDPVTDVWTNLSKLPVGMYGIGATVLNDEILLVGGNDGSPKKTVYHYNPVQETWSKGNNIVTGGVFDVEVQEINGDVVWASGDMSTYAYSNWNQAFTSSSEYEDFAGTYSGWVNSPIIDLRPNIHSTATPVQLTMNGTNAPGGTLGIQYRVGSSSTIVSNGGWIGPDGTVNTSFSIGLTDLNLSDPANYLQYRIEMKIYDMVNWDEPDLDEVTVLAEHASFVSPLPQIVNPQSETLILQTDHALLGDGERYIGFASCNNQGGILGQWSTVHYDGQNLTIDDPEGHLLAIDAEVNSTSIQGELVDWSIDFSELTGLSHVCAKVGTDATKVSQYIHSDVMEVDNSITVILESIDGYNSGESVIGGIPLTFNLVHIFESTGMTLSSGELQARLHFDTRVINSVNNEYITWLNDTTQWYNLSAGEVDKITYTLPENVSGIVNISVDSRSDQSFSMLADSNNTWLILDNDNPIIIESEPIYGSYINSEENREISITVADNSGFIHEDLIVEYWVESLDDGSDGSFPDGAPQFTEYRSSNFSLESQGSLWWFNLTLSDNTNSDHQKVYLRILAKDLVDSELSNNTIWWSTRDARNAVIHSFSNVNDTTIWEVARNTNWQLNISDANSINDLQTIWVELGDDSDFGIRYDVATKICSVLDGRIDADRSICLHSIENNYLIFEFELYANWDIDLSMLSEGDIKIRIEDIDGITSTTYQNMWTFSDSFDLNIEIVEDISGENTGEISNQTIVMINDNVRIKGTLVHQYSGVNYNGDLSIKWWGSIQGQSWLGGSSIEVIDGQINANIPMPSTGGIIDMNFAFLDPWETRTIGSYSAGEFLVDEHSPVILTSSIETYSRYHLESVSIGVNIEEDTSWTNALELSCKVVSTEIDWPEIVIEETPSNVFQGKTLFSFEFDFSSQGDPSQLSPEARIDCWAYGRDDAGWELINENENPITDVWLSFPLNDIGPNIMLKDVKINGEPNAGTKLRLDVTIFNDGEALQTPFNITVYSIVDGEETLTGRYTQSQIASGQTVVKRLSVTVPSEDWTLKIVVDEDSQIWELNENDNLFERDFESSESFNVGLIAGIVGAIFAIFSVFVILRRNGDNELSSAEKKMPSIENLEKSSKPENVTPPNQITSKPKRGPPPKKEPVQEISPTEISTAMSKLSLDTLPGNNQPQKVPSYESLPAGGDYDYTAEGTFYIGSAIGKWKLEDDGSFTKIE